MTTIYTWITDPAHGWLTVPLAELQDLGIADDISKFSYIDTSKGVVYLEQDIDALRFIEAKGVDLSSRCRKQVRKALSRWCAENTVSRHHDNPFCGSAGYGPHPVRDCDKYPAKESPWRVGIPHDPYMCNPGPRS